MRGIAIVAVTKGASMARHLTLIALAAATLAGCASGPNRPAPVTTTPIISRPAIADSTGNALVAGTLAGQSAQAMMALFGQPALDVREGDARKLQFLGQDCVLDAYLYPRGRSEAVVTHVDARLPDGRDADRAACIASLQRR